MSLAILFHFLCAQHVPDINISIIRSLRLFCWITTLVVLFLDQCVLEIRCGWRLKPATRIPLQPNHTESPTHIEPRTACNTDTTPTQPHRRSNTHWTKNNTTNMVIQQNSRKLLMMDILMSETCWADKKWNKIGSDIKLVFYSSSNMNIFRCPKITVMLISLQTECLLTVQTCMMPWMLLILIAITSLNIYIYIYNMFLMEIRINWKIWQITLWSTSQIVLRTLEG